MNLRISFPLVVSAFALGCSDPAPTETVPARDVVQTDATADTSPTDTNPTDATATDATATDASASDGGVPANLTVPAGNSSVLEANARGVQIYTCAATTGDAGVTFAWTLHAPEATLYDDAGNLIGTHFLGPNWRTVDGSQVTGAVQERANAPAGDAIPWLLLRATMNAGTGVLGRVAFVQRLATRGGVAPATGCGAATVGAETSVNYTARYVFWAPSGDAGAAATGLLPAALNLPESGLVVQRRAVARGDQNYRCTAVVADAGAPYQWTFVAPSATLYDSEMRSIGMHSAGPTWRTTDGAEVVGAVAQRADSPTAGNIPWLLLRATSNMGTAGFGLVRYVHRVATAGGVAPTTGCDSASVGTDRAVPYTADYYFWAAP